MVIEMESQTLAVQQAVFASHDRGHVKGYHLVAQSPGIDSQTAAELTRWAPTQLPSDAPENWTISGWRLEDGRYVVARTVYGGPEYSNRGGTQVVTLFLVLTEAQFLSYEYDAVSVATTALTLGALRLPLDIRQRVLCEVELPDGPIVDPRWRMRQTRMSDAAAFLLAEVEHALAQSRRIAVVGLSDAVAAVQQLISRMSLEQRREFSFTTGLSPSIRRPLEAHFFMRPDVVRHRALESQDVVSFNAHRISAPT